jgi:hypothetical protein
MSQPTEMILPHFMENENSAPLKMRGDICAVLPKFGNVADEERPIDTLGRRPAPQFIH